MIWLLVCLAPLVAIVARVLSLRRRPEIWWLAFTLTLVGIMAGCVLLVNEAAVNQLLRVPNLSYLLSNLGFLLAGGSVTIFVHTLRHNQPSLSVAGGIAAATTGAGAVLVLLWLVAPIHSQDVASFRAIPLSPTLIVSETVFHVLFIAVLANVAICAATLARQTPAGDPARRIGLIIIAASSTLDVVAHLVYLARVALQPTIGSPALAIATVADLVTVIAVLGICVGTTALLAVPRLLQFVRARRLAQELRPLWYRTLELFPEVAMRGGWRLRGRTDLQSERMLIEIADALRLLPVPVSETNDPCAVVAEAFRHPSPRSSAGRTAAEALPTPTSRLDEEEQLLRLAHAYRPNSRQHAQTEFQLSESGT